MLLRKHFAKTSFGVSTLSLHEQKYFKMAEILFGAGPGQTYLVIPNGECLMIPTDNFTKMTSKSVKNPFKNKNV